MHVANGTYFSVIYGSEGYRIPILAIMGISSTDEREVLTFRMPLQFNRGSLTKRVRTIKGQHHLHRLIERFRGALGQTSMRSFNE